MSEITTTAIVLATPGSLLRPESEEERLRRLAAKLYERGRSENTKRGYEGDLVRFEAWCEALKRCALPASEESIVLYVAHMADPYRPRTELGRSGPCKPATIKRALAAIAWNHRSRAQPSPITHRVRDFVRKACSALAVPPRQAAPLGVEQLQAMVNAMDTGVVSLRDQAVLLLGFAGAFRRSEIAALDFADLEFVDDGVVIRLRRSKTDREGRGIEVAVVPAEEPTLCPVAALQRWLEARGHEPGPLFFRNPDGVTCARLRDRDVDAIVKLWARRAAIQAPRNGMTFSAHSLRAGFVTSAVLAGRPESLVKAHTRHRSYEVFSRYVRRTAPLRDHPGRGVL